MPDMVPVAEGFVPRSPAPAEGNPVSDYVGSPVGGLDRDPVTDPERPMFAPGGVFDHDNGFFKSGFDRLTGLSVTENEPAGGTVACLIYRRVPGFRGIGSLREVPDPPGPQAEPCVRTEPFIIGQFQFRPSDDGGVLKIRFIPGSLGTVKVNLRMRPVAEGFVLRMPAAA